MKIEGFDPNNRIKEPGLEEAANQVSMEQNTVVLDDIEKKILALKEEQKAISEDPEIAAYLKKSQERMIAREKSSELQQIVENKWERNADSLNEAIENLRGSEKREAEIVKELEELESHMTPAMIDDLRRVEEIDQMITDLESQREDIDLKQTEGGIGEVDGFSLN